MLTLVLTLSPPVFDPLAPDDVSPHGYCYDAAGRRFKLDRFGQIIRRGSRRPGHWPIQEWAKLTGARKREIAKEEEARLRGAKPEVAPPAAPAVQAGWDRKSDSWWNDVDAGVHELNKLGDKLLMIYTGVPTLALDPVVLIQPLMAIPSG